MDLKILKNIDTKNFKKLIEYTNENFNLYFYGNEEIAAIRLNNELIYRSYITIDAYNKLINYDDYEKRFYMTVFENCFREASNNDKICYITLEKGELCIELAY